MSKSFIPISEEKLMTSSFFDKIINHTLISRINSLFISIISNIKEVLQIPESYDEQKLLEKYRALKNTYERIFVPGLYHTHTQILNELTTYLTKPSYTGLVKSELYKIKQLFVTMYNNIFQILDLPPLYEYYYEYDGMTREQVVRILDFKYNSLLSKHVASFIPDATIKNNKYLNELKEKVPLIEIQLYKLLEKEDENDEENDEYLFGKKRICKRRICKRRICKRSKRILKRKRSK